MKRLAMKRRKFSVSHDSPEQKEYCNAAAKGVLRSNIRIRGELRTVKIRELETASAHPVFGSLREQLNGA